jgi:hypothetical protein
MNDYWQVWPARLDFQKLVDAASTRGIAGTDQSSATVMLFEPTQCLGEFRNMSDVSALQSGLNGVRQGMTYQQQFSVQDNYLFDLTSWDVNFLTGIIRFLRDAGPKFSLFYV